MILRKLEVDVTPILAGGAIVTVALGLGAQNYVRDIIGGLFLILEDQVRVGDVVNINGKGGQVESIQLRTITLRDADGTVHIFPNGSISAISNMTKNFSYYVIDLGIAYEENADRVMALIKEIGAELEKDPKYSEKILAPLEMMGVDAFAESAVIIKFRIKTVPLEQWSVGRSCAGALRTLSTRRASNCPTRTFRCTPAKRPSLFRSRGTAASGTAETRRSTGKARNGVCASGCRTCLPRVDRSSPRFPFPQFRVR